VSDGTAGVLLRTPTDADLDVLYRLAADLDTWEERGDALPMPLTRAEFDARPAAEQRALFVIEVDGTAVGTASLSGFDPLAHHAEAGMNLLAEARGRGVGTAAMRQLVEFGFGRLNLRRIHLQLIASNAGALRAYQKAGFVLEGRLREHAWVRGGYEDLILMAILRAEHSPQA
jgi:RimJ/RimL family protein N-acetyltransferase